MTSTRSTIPAPPPNGVSSTWPPPSGEWARMSRHSSVLPAASALRTWRWSRNHWNHSGKSVKTSISICARRSPLAEEGEVDLDPPCVHVDAPDRVPDHWHQQLAAVAATDLEHLAGGQPAQRADHADGQLAIEHRAPLQVAPPPFVLLQRGRGAARHRQRQAAQ